MPKVMVEFDLDEEVRPDAFAQRVVQACAVFGAMLPGESLWATEGYAHFTVDERPPCPPWPGHCDN